MGECQAISLKLLHVLIFAIPIRDFPHLFALFLFICLVTFERIIKQGDSDSEAIICFGTKFKL